MAKWNQKDLPIPPVSTYKTSNKDIDLKKFSNLCREIKTFFEDNKYIEAEHLVLSRIIYRMKQKFRSSKDFKATEKVCKSLNSLFNIDIASHLETIIALIPTKYKKETYLPSKNLLDFLLVRLQGISCLLKKIVECCIEAAGLLFIRLKIGHFWKIGILVYSVISRIYTLIKFATNKVCELYNKLIFYSSKLQGASTWLPADYELPLDLKEWLDIDWLELDEDIQLVDITELSRLPFLELVDDEDDIQFCDEYIIIKDEEDKTKTKTELTTKLRGFEMNDDVGDIVEIEDLDFKLLPKNEDSVVELSDNSLETDENLPKFKYQKHQNLNEPFKKQKIKNGKVNKKYKSKNRDTSKILDIVNLAANKKLKNKKKLKKHKPNKTCNDTTSILKANQKSKKRKRRPKND